MKKSEQKITAPIFDIDTQEMNALVDEFVRARELDKDQEVKDYYDRLKSVEEALMASKDNFRTLFDLHMKIGEEDLLGLKNPTSLHFSECGSGWRIYNRQRDPVAFISEELHMYAVCKKLHMYAVCKKVVAWNEVATRDIQFSADTLFSQISENGLDGSEFCQYFSFVNGTTYRTLIETMEYMVRTLPLYVTAFKEYIQKKGM